MTPAARPPLTNDQRRVLAHIVELLLEQRRKRLVENASEGVVTPSECAMDGTNAVFQDGQYGA